MHNEASNGTSTKQHERQHSEYEAQREAELEALAEGTRPNEEVPYGFEYRQSVGDLVVEMMAPGVSSWSAEPSNAVDCKTFECLFMENVALELRILNKALAAPFTTDGDISDDVSQADACRALQLMSRRVRAAAELTRRMRAARWGNPHFGGGELLAAAGQVGVQ